VIIRNSARNFAKFLSWSNGHEPSGHIIDLYKENSRDISLFHVLHDAILTC